MCFQEFSLDCYFRQIWHDKRLQFNGPLASIPLASKVLRDIWTPDTYIRYRFISHSSQNWNWQVTNWLRNGRQSYLHTLTVPNILLRVSQDGQVYVSQRFDLHPSGLSCLLSGIKCWY